jgi:hypothetical protein
VFDDARLLNLNKKRREADVLRCVRRCQRGEYIFAPHARRLRFVAPQHRLSPHRVQAGHTDAVVARRGRLAKSVPLHVDTLAAKSVVGDKTPPPRAVSN